MKNTPNKKRRSPIWLINKEELQILLDKSNSYKSILSHFGLVSKGNNNLTLKRRIEEESLNLNKFKINWNLREKNRKFSNKSIPLREILVTNSTYNRQRLKFRLIREGILKEQCEKCGCGVEWQGEPISLQLDHINGIHDDNRIENLRILCPNCHSQTPDFAGKKNKISKPINLHPYGKGLPKFKRRKVERPNKETLKKMVWEKPTKTIAKDYGVSDKAIEKWCKNYEINKPPRGYWTRTSQIKI